MPAKKAPAQTPTPLPTRRPFLSGVGGAAKESGTIKIERETRRDEEQPDDSLAGS